MAYLSTFNDGALGSVVRALINSLVGRADHGGWAEYDDDEYTAGAPLSLVADTDTDLPNNAALGPRDQLPQDVDFYDPVGQVITGRAGDAFLVTIDFEAVPQNANTTIIEIWIDIGGGSPDLHRTLVSFPKGAGVIRPVHFNFGAHSLATWAANGGTVRVRTNGPCDVYDIRYSVISLHQAR